MDKYFRPAGNLDDNSKIDGSSYFSSPGDIGQQMGDDIDSSVTVDEINAYIETIIREKKYENVIGAAQVVVTFSRLREMVDEGLNITSAKCLNPKCIVVEFQQLKNVENKFNK